MLRVQLLSSRTGVALCEHDTGLTREDALQHQVVQAFMVHPGCVVGNEVFDLPCQFSQQGIMLQQDAVLERAMPAFDVLPENWASENETIRLPCSPLTEEGA